MGRQQGQQQGQQQQQGQRQRQHKHWSRRGSSSRFSGAAAGAGWQQQQSSGSSRGSSSGCILSTNAVLSLSASDSYNLSHRPTVACPGACDHVDADVPVRRESVRGRGSTASNVRGRRASAGSFNREICKFVLHRLSPPPVR